MSNAKLFETSPLFRKYEQFILESGIEDALLQKHIADEKINILSNSIIIHSKGVEISNNLKNLEGLSLNIVSKNEERFNEILNENRKVSREENRASEIIYGNAKHILLINITKDLKEPLRIINIADELRGIHILVKAESNTTSTIIEETYSKHQFVSGLIREIIVMDGSTLNYGIINVGNFNAYSLGIMKAYVNNNATLRLSEFHAGNKLDHNIVDVFLDGKNAYVENVSLILGKFNDRYNLTNNLHHVKDNTKSYAAIKSVLFNNAKSLQKGIIKIYKGAKNSQGYLSEHAVVFDNAWVDAIPSLEIDTNDVKATHSSYTTKISEDQIFYLMSRGLSREEAVKLIIYGFYHHLLYRVKDIKIKALMRVLIENAFNNVFKYPWEFEDVVEEFEFEEMHETEREIDIFERHYKYRN